MAKIRAVVLALFVTVLAVGVLGGAEAMQMPDRRDAYTAPWLDGANVLRVQRIGEHFALLTINTTRIVDSRRVTRRGPSGELLGVVEVFLVADVPGHVQISRDGKPATEWWDAVLSIERRQRTPPPALPSISAERSRP